MNNTYYRVNDVPPSFFSDIDMTPFEPFNITADSLLIFYKYHSGLKILSYPIMLDSKSAQGIERINFYINSMFSKKWQSYSDSLLSEYDALTNVSYDEDIKSDNRQNDSRFNKYKNHNDTYKKEEQSIRIDSNQKDVNKNYSNDNTVENNFSYDNNDTHNETNNSIFGFNSTEPVPSDNTSELNVDRLASQEDNMSKSSSDSISDRHVKDFKSENLSNKTDTSEQTYKSEDETVDRIGKRKIQRNRSGYDGKSPAELLTAELEYRKNLFLDIVMDDLDKILTINVYD